MARVLLLNKPFDVLSQFTDRAGRRTLTDFVEARDVYPAGRLDRDSEGLLVLTDSPRLAGRITDPRHKMTKTYWAQVEGAPTGKDLAPLREGMVLKDGRTRPAPAEIVPPSFALWDRQPPIRVRRHIPATWVRITLAEGRNRQVRRMFAAIGFPVLRLIRYRVGSWTIDGIAPGEWVEIGTHDARGE